MSRNRKMEGYGKRFLTVLLALAMIVSLTPSLGALTGGALGAQEVYATADPVTGVKLEGDTLSWDPYPGAASYSISYAKENFVYYLCKFPTLKTNGKSRIYYRLFYRP